MEDKIMKLEKDLDQVRDVVKKMYEDSKGNDAPVLVSLKKSDDVKDLLMSLVEFQKEVENIEKSSNNPFYGSSYANLDKILSATRPILAKHNLCINQFAIPGGDKSVSIKTILWHSSGQFIESDSVPIKPSKLDVQGYGAVETYSKRYAIGSLLQLSFCEDDDGNSQVKNPPKAQPKETTPAPQPKRSSRI